MGRHPGKIELMTYAESLAGKGGALSVKTGRHIGSCKACQAEAEGMRASLEFIHSAPDLEPTADFTNQLLLAAHNERQQLQRRSGRQALMAVGKGLSYAAGILIVGALCFGAALSGRATASAGMHESIVSTGAQPDAVVSPEVLRKAAAEVQTLAAALNFQPKTPPSMWELEHRRAVQALGADIEAARAALERNPGCVRASRMIDTHLQRQAQALKALYVERSL